MFEISNQESEELGLECVLFYLPRFQNHIKYPWVSLRAKGPESRGKERFKLEPSILPMIVLFHRFS